jgi:uncharacterized protein YcaQ
VRAAPLTLEDLSRFAVARSLFPPTTLKRALDRMGFVQADPIRAPARAQDLILRHRVRGYRAGDLERLYGKVDVGLEVEEDFFVNYGYVTRKLQALMHPRSDSTVPADSPSALHIDAPAKWPAEQRRRARQLLEFVREKGEVHPREVERRLGHGRITNYWGGSSNATTRLLEAMHYRGLLRVVRRESGTRIYAPREHPVAELDDAARRSRIDALVDAVVGIYAPLPARSLSYLVRRLRYAAPQWRNDLKAALDRARERLAHARVASVDWYWPRAEDPKRAVSRGDVRLLAPFDPVVHDLDRFELLWGWVYRFEAYTPAPKRLRGYYALPLLWRDRVVGWGNLTVDDGALEAQFGYAGSAPRDRGFREELDLELDRVRAFLGLETLRPVSAGRRSGASGSPRSRTTPRRSRRSSRRP